VKKIAVFLLLSMVWALPALSDEIALKDGKRVAWKSLIDQGDQYAVETTEGMKMQIKKSDVDRLVMGVPAAPPLTGATFAFEKKKTVMVDLMPKIDPKGEGVTGEWKRQGATLSCTAGISHAKIPIAHSSLPEEYDLTLVIERKEKCNAFFVGLVADGNQCTVQFDAIEGSLCGLQLIDGKNFYDGEGNGTKVPGPCFKNNVPRTIKLMVRKEIFCAQVDGKDLILWRADWKKVSNQPALSIPQKNLLFLGLYDSTWKVSSITLTYMK
jgi:hypothetical protein